MAVYRVDVLIEDYKPVFKWIEHNVPKDLVVRKIAYETSQGWFVKTAFKRRSEAELFHHRWFPEADDHTVAPFGPPT